MRLVEKKALGKLGRVVIPSHVRNEIGLESGDPIGVYVDGNQIIIRPLNLTDECALCGRTRRLVDHRRKKVCESCIRELAGVVERD